MENKEIAQIIHITSQLLELHDANSFKINAYKNASFRIERTDVALKDLQKAQIQKIQGIGPSIAANIWDLITTGKFEDLEQLLLKTPRGVLEMLKIRGVGPKKIKVIWHLLQIKDMEQLLNACNENRLISVDGFGKKIQENIKKEIEYIFNNKGRYLYAIAETEALLIQEYIKSSGLADRIEITGELRRCNEVIEKIEILVESTRVEDIFDTLNKSTTLNKNKKESTARCWKGTSFNSVPVEITVCKKESFAWELFNTTGSKQHMGLFKIKEKENGNFSSEEEIYTTAGLPYIPPEMREGINEIQWIKNNKAGDIIKLSDLKGILHVHSTYSDGIHSLEEMALSCKEAGFEYLGISDHSQSAFYANGLKPERIIQQHNEIDMLNKKLAPFKIFKGIESDILNEGSLDYEDELLDKFDFIIASIHSNLNMTEEKATQRLIKAIENPYTTILGHLTGRLLLSREGYPVDHKKVIDACSVNNVIIELNTNPKRLELDWRWIQYAIQKNVMISINPDAHKKEGYQHMYYGICMARKGGLLKQMTFNAFSREQIISYFLNKKHQSSCSISNVNLAAK